MHTHWSPIDQILNQGPSFSPLTTSVTTTGAIPTSSSTPANFTGASQLL